MQKLLSEIKTLFTENFACFRKFWVYQFVISLLGVMVTLPLSSDAVAMLSAFIPKSEFFRMLSH